jgi:hypothetical protein
MVACSASGTLAVGKYHKWSLNLPRERLIKGGGLGQEVLRQKKIPKTKVAINFMVSLVVLL